MKTLPIFSFVLLLLFVKACPVFCQQIIFNKVLLPDGKTFNHVAGITQDVNGYMWYATKKGLYSYDGYHMTSYKNNPLNANSLMSNNLESVFADSSGIIWIGGLGMGLDRLDPVTGTFTHFHHDSSDRASLSNDTVIVILVDKEGTLWIGTLGGLDQFDPKTNKFLHYRHKANDPTSISNNQVRAIYEDSQGILWIGTGSPYPWDGGGPQDGGLNRMNKRTGTFTRYLHDPNNIHSLANNKVTAIFEDNQGVLWIGTAGNGLHRMNEQQGSFERIINDPAHPEKLSGPALKKVSPAYSHITFITQDAAGRFWIGSSDDGLNYYDPGIGKIINYNYKGTENDSTGFNDNGVWKAFTSRDGILWIGTLQGNLYRIDPFQWNIPHYASPGVIITSFYEESAGILWIGTEDGLFRKDLTTGIIKRFVHDPLNPASLSHNYIQYILKDRQGNIWIGTIGGGLNLLNRDDETFTHYRHDSNNSNSISNDGVGFIYEDSEAKLWIGTMNGLNLMDRKKGTFTSFFFDPIDTVPGGKNNITYVLKDRQGKLWVGSWAGFGLHNLNQQTGKFKDYLNGIKIYNICEDAAGNLWLGANEGLYLYNRTSDAFSPFVDPSSLKSIPDIYSIIEDNQKNLWVCSLDGFAKLNQQRNETSLYSSNHGVKGEDLTFTYSHKGPKGMLYFSDLSGYFAFFPDQLNKNTKPPEIMLTTFRLADQIIKPGNHGPLKDNLSQVKEIQLLYNQNVFSFDFAAIDYTNPEENRHLFILENYDNNWRQGGADRKAYYFNIPPGKYVFRVKAANSNGVWAEKKIDIIITPPWWNTWWFYVLCIISASFVIYILFRYRLNQKLKAYELRNTISRDLHDEVGSTLSSIGFLSSMALEDVNTNKEKANNTLTSINESANKMLDAMNDIIWNIQPQNDTLENIIVRMISFASELLEAKKISLNFNVEDNVKQLKLGLTVRHDFLIIYKEAVNNLAKYSAATNANICLKYEQPHLILTISDNGKGFDSNTISYNGNGLKNMQTRAKKIGALYHLQTAGGQGTTITLQVKPT